MSPAGRTWGVMSGQSQTPKSGDESGKRNKAHERSKAKKNKDHKRMQKWTVRIKCARHKTVKKKKRKRF